MKQMRKWNWREEGLRMGFLAFLRFYKVRLGWWGRVGMGKTEQGLIPCRNDEFSGSQSRHPQEMISFLLRTQIGNHQGITNKMLQKMHGIFCVCVWGGQLKHSWIGLDCGSVTKRLLSLSKASGSNPSTRQWMNEHTLLRVGTHLCPNINIHSTH